MEICLLFRQDQECDVQCVRFVEAFHEKIPIYSSTLRVTILAVFVGVASRLLFCACLMMTLEKLFPFLRRKKIPQDVKS